MSMPNGTLVQLIGPNLEYGIIVNQPGEGVSSQESPEAYGIRLFDENGSRGGNWYLPTQFKEVRFPLSPLPQKILLATLKWMVRNEKKLERRIQRFKQLALEDY